MHLSLYLRTFYFVLKLDRKNLNDGNLISGGQHILSEVPFYLLDKRRFNMFLVQLFCLCVDNITQKFINGLW